MLHTNFGKTVKLKIKVKYFGSMPPLEVIKNGDWIDLRARVGCDAYKGTLVRIPLGVAMKLPRGFEAILAPRSSAYRSGFIIPNSIGVIDNTYQGDYDEWQCTALFFEDNYIRSEDRICQFRIQLSQKASLWSKLKWLFSSGIELVEVETLTAKNRGGFGSTGRK